MMQAHRHKWRQAAVYHKIRAAEASALSVVIDKVRSKIDPPIDRDHGPKNAEINKVGIDFLNEFAAAELRVLEKEAATFRKMRAEAEGYLKDVEEVRGPMIENQITVDMFQLNQTTRPYALRSVDVMAQLLTTLIHYRKTGKSSNQVIKNADGKKIPLGKFLKVADELGIGLSDKERAERGIIIDYGPEVEKAGGENR